MASRSEPQPSGRAARRRHLWPALGLVVAAAASAHDLEQRVGRAEAAVLQLGYGEEHPFAGQAYQIFYAEERLPFQTGRSDAQGRIVFLSDRPGAYRIKTHSEDGHGGTFEVYIDAGGEVRYGDAPAGRWARAALGVGLLFGGFGVMALIMRRARA